MRTYLAYIKTTLKLVMRDRVVLFFNYFLPLLFFIVFAQSFRAERGGAITQVITMVLIFGVLGSGFFGAGLRAVQERELGILRRFKVAPITPLPVLVASLATGLISYLPGALLILGIAYLFYGMPWPERWISLVILLSLGLLAFRSIGLIIASVANSMQESQIIIQLLYLPMLFLSGATFPLSMMPTWLQVAGQFLPATYLYTGLQGILVRKDGLAENASSLAALAATLLVATFLGVKLFRWEKDERMPPAAKLWLAAVLLPFLALGIWQARSLENVSKAKLLYRDMRRSRALLIRGPRIVVGDGRVIEAGGVLLREGKIAAVYEKVPPEETGRVLTLEAAGKTLLPGLRDREVQLLAPGGALDPNQNYDPVKAALRALAAYLYCGVTHADSSGDAQTPLQAAWRRISRGDRTGAYLASSGRIFTTPKGRGTEHFRSLPETVRGLVERETAYFPQTADEARGQVEQLKALGAPRVKVMLDAGTDAAPLDRLKDAVFEAIARRAQELRLPLIVWTGDARDVAGAIQAKAAVIVHGSSREVLPDELFARMKRERMAYIPVLSPLDAAAQMERGGPVTLLDGVLLQQAAEEHLLAATRKLLAARKPAKEFQGEAAKALAVAVENLRRAYRAGVRLETGTGSGAFLLPHGPVIHHEMRLWANAGIPAHAILRAAASSIVAAGADASLLLLDGDPLAEIAATERISAVFLSGERVDRASLLEQKD